MKKELIFLLTALIFAFTLLNSPSIFAKKSNNYYQNEATDRDIVQCPSTVIEYEPSRIIVQIIDNELHEWNEYDLDSYGTYCIKLISPIKKALSESEAANLLKRSSTHILLEKTNSEGYGRNKLNQETISALDSYKIMPINDEILRVFGDDERVRITNTLYFPYNTIAFFMGTNRNTKWANRCTAFFVSRYVAMTNAHCVDDIEDENTGSTYPVEGVSLYPGQTELNEGDFPWDHISPFGLVYTTDWEIHPNYTFYDNDHPHDIAVLKFDTPISDYITTFMPIQFDSYPSYLYTLGYPEVVQDDDPSYAMWESSDYDNVYVSGVDDRLLDHRIDVSEGNSGGPVFTSVNNNLRIAGLVAGSRFRNLTRTNTGPRFVSQDYELLVGWIAWSPDPILSISKNNISAPSDGLAQSVIVTSNITWSVSTDREWITVEPNSGTNDDYFVVTINANTSTNSRSGTVSISGGGITEDIIVTQAGTSAVTYSVSGQVTYLGIGLDGTTIFCDNGGGTVTTNQNGYYSITLPSGWSGSCSPILTGYDFWPSAYGYSNLSSDRTDRDYEASIATHEISGQVTIDGSGLVDIFINCDNDGGTATTDNNGNYTINVSHGWSGSCDPRRSGYRFSPLNRNYSSVTANRSQQNYEATDITTLEPIVNASTHSIDFGEVDISSTKVKSFILEAENLTERVTITSSGNFLISRMTMAYRDFRDSTTVRHSDGQINHEIHVLFEPQSEGYYEGNIKLTYPGLDPINIEVTGVGRVREFDYAWSKISTDYNFVMEDIAMFSEKEGVAIGGRGLILKTYDGGLSWELIENDAERALYSLSFVDDTHGYATGFEVLMKTDDGGETWNRVNMSHRPEHSHFPEKDIGYLIWGRQFYKTVNGGGTWSEVNTSDLDRIENLFFINRDIGYVIDDRFEGFSVFKTTNGGSSWSEVFSDPERRQLMSIYFYDLNHGIIVGADEVYVTKNGGQSWQERTVVTRNGPNVACFFNSDDGIVAGENGAIWHTENGGDDWIIRESNTEESLYSVSCFSNGDSKIAIAVGANGTILRYGPVEQDEEPVTYPGIANLISPSDDALNIGVMPELIWAVSENTYSYHLQLAIDPSFDSPFLDVEGLEKTSYQVENELDHQETYYWRVRGMNEDGYGGWSEDWSFTTRGKEPGLISLISPEDNSHNIDIMTSFSWADSEIAEFYEIQISLDDDFNVIMEQLNSLQDNQLKLDNALDYDTRYFWRVRALNHAGESNWSQVWSFTTVIQKPEVAQLISPNHNSQEVELLPTLIWESSNRAETYKLQLTDDSDFSNVLIEVSEIQETEYQISEELTKGKAYYWRVRAENRSGYSDWSNTSSFTTVMPTDAEVQEIPTEVALQQNYPNPFNPSTQIRFAVPEQAHVRLLVYNMLGQRVATLLNESKSPGWHDVTFDASELSSGLYIYRLEADGYVETKSMMFVK